MSWIALKSYSNAGIRHYAREPHVRKMGAIQQRRYPISGEPMRNHTTTEFTDSAWFLCTQGDGRAYQTTHRGNVIDMSASGHRNYTSGGMTSKKAIDLTQRNICADCLKLYLMEHPEYQAAFDALKGAE